MSTRCMISYDIKGHTYLDLEESAHKVASEFFCLGFTVAISNIRREEELHYQLTSGPRYYWSAEVLAGGAPRGK